jgi:hypothetical protein
MELIIRIIIATTKVMEVEGVMNGFCFDPTNSLNVRAMSTIRCFTSFTVSNFSDTSPFGFCSPPLNYFSFAGRNCGSK